MGIYILPSFSPIQLVEFRLEYRPSRSRCNIVLYIVDFFFRIFITICLVFKKQSYNRAGIGGKNPLPGGITFTTKSGVTQLMFLITINQKYPSLHACMNSIPAPNSPKVEKTNSDHDYKLNVGGKNQGLCQLPTNHEYIFLEGKKTRQEY